MTSALLLSKEICHQENRSFARTGTDGTPVFLVWQARKKPGRDSRMDFSVIYSVDIPAGVNMRPFVPPRCKQLWEETEGDEQYDYDYLEDRWEKGHHRKWVTILDQDQFDEFLDHTGLIAEDVQTMGSIGAPGFGFSWAPAISFRGDDLDSIQSAYATPLASKAEMVRFLRGHEVPVPAVLLDDDDQQYFWDEAIDREAPWEAIRKTVIEMYS
jgi:hypothetical protein